MMARKTLDENFADWESSVFGFGYGSGERHVIPALGKFLSLCKGMVGQYDYEELERELTPAVAWLLINALGHADILEYGTSPRYAWLTKRGQRLRAYVLSRSPDEVIEATRTGPNYTPCYPDVPCNCNGEGRVCPNPFWVEDLR